MLPTLPGAAERSQCCGELCAAQRLGALRHANAPGTANPSLTSFPLLACSGRALLSLLGRIRGWGQK